MSGEDLRLTLLCVVVGLLLLNLAAGTLAAVKAWQVLSKTAELMLIATECLAAVKKESAAAAASAKATEKSAKATEDAATNKT